MTNFIKIGAIGLGMVLLAFGFWVSGLPGLALVAGVVGLLWLAADWRAPEGRPLLDGLGFAGFCILAADGVFQKLPGWLGLAVVLLALAGWDLARFGHRLNEVTAPQPAPEAPEAAEAIDLQVEEKPAGSEVPLLSGAAAAERMERAHLVRLGLALGGGLLLGALALLVHISLSFVVALAVGILAIYALSKIVRGVNR